ncbi:Coenzyme F420 hydrogenase/dehydrogenase, beta subunit C-terminal domain [Candidatus Woesearchaeota archaeon]|nr:Coenzyme F420 hydrogenase/dehydrogenase, beta subunit C-terminal domain [Candidatus Woesearchaeota archaeon]
MANFHDLSLKACTLCGSCELACPVNSIKVTDKKPTLIKNCINCGTCVNICPGMHFPFPEQANKFIGNYRKLGIGYAKDPNIRHNATSGGVTTQFLLYLLENKIVDNVLITQMDESNPYNYKVKLVNSIQDLLLSQGSKYRRFPLNRFIKLVEKTKGTIAVVCLPCQVQGIRALQKINNKYTKKIKLVIGLFCGFNMHPSSISFMLKKHNLKKEQVKELAYRNGNWPGGFYLRTNKKSISYPKYIYDLLNLVFIPNRCLYCIDLTSEFADISIGDCWVKGKKQYNTIIIRSELAESLLPKAPIHFEPISLNNLIKSHKFNLMNKKYGAFYRIRKDQPPINYGFRNKLNLKQKLKYSIFYRIIKLSKSKLFHLLLYLLPLKFFISIARLRRSIK